MAGLGSSPSMEIGRVSGFGHRMWLKMMLAAWSELADDIHGAGSSGGTSGRSKMWREECTLKWRQKKNEERLTDKVLQCLCQGKFR